MDQNIIILSSGVITLPLPRPCSANLPATIFGGEHSEHVSLDHEVVLSLTIALTQEGASSGRTAAADI